MSIWDRLRKAFQAVREYPRVAADLNTAQSELRQVRQKLDRRDEEYSFLNRQMEEQNYVLKFYSQQSRAFQTALLEFCPSLSSAEDMERFYNTVAPILDTQGFTLYHTAEQLTEIDVSSFFPYEDNHGMFEDANGRQLLEWITAAHFNAVDWTVVQGTCCESATLREVDTSTPEYQAFERKLYRAALTRMGFEDLLGPSEHSKSREKEVVVTEKDTTELKLYSPLFGELTEQEYDDPEPLDGSDLVAFQEAISQGIGDEQMPEEEERGLMTYFYGSKAVDEKVVSCFPNVEQIDGRLYGVAVCQLKGSLTPSELEELKEYCTGQYADGWGEGFEQHPRKTAFGDLYVKFWKHNDFFIRTAEEMETAKVPARSKPQLQRGGER